MRAFVILSLLCVALLAFVSPAKADDADDAARRRALALLRLAAPMDEPAATPIKHQPACIADVPTARAKAAAESRPLLIWVGGCDTVDKAVRGAFPDAVHCHCDSINGSSEHRLLIPVREGSYAVFDSQKLTKASVPDIRAVLERAPAKTSPRDCEDCPHGQCAVPQTSPLVQGVRVYSAPTAVQCATGR